MRVGGSQTQRQRLCPLDTGPCVRVWVLCRAGWGSFAARGGGPLPRGVGVLCRVCYTLPRLVSFRWPLCPHSTTTGAAMCNRRGKASASTRRRLPSPTSTPATVTFVPSWLNGGAPWSAWVRSVTRGRGVDKDQRLELDLLTQKTAGAPYSRIEGREFLTQQGQQSSWRGWARLVGRGHIFHPAIVPKGANGSLLATNGAELAAAGTFGRVWPSDGGALLGRNSLS
jgi:hypothetical protein